jgi:predicted RNase H-like nuclease (RuvC/YqgF family)
MILEIIHQRDMVASLAEENSKLSSLTENLTLQVEAMTRIADLHKQAADDRLRALELKDEIERLWKKSLEDSNKKIASLEAQNGFLRKLVMIAFGIGLALGVTSQ